MKKIKFSKRFVKVAVIVIVSFWILNLCIFNIVINGINIVPSKFKNVPVSFLTPDLDWCSRPSDLIFKYGLPKTVSEKSEINGSRDFEFEFIYDEKKVEFTACNRIFINNNFSTYYFYVDCKTPKEAKEFFDECHKRMLEFYGDEEGFSLEDESGSMKKEYIIWSGATGIVFEMSYSEDDSVVFIKSHCQY